MEIHEDPSSPVHVLHKEALLQWSQLRLIGHSDFTLRHLETAQRFKNLLGFEFRVLRSGSILLTRDAKTVTAQNHPG